MAGTEESLCPLPVTLSDRKLGQCYNITNDLPTQVMHQSIQPK